MNNFTITYTSLKDYSDYASFGFSINETSSELTCVVHSVSERIQHILTNAFNDLVKYFSGIDLGLSTRDSDRQLFINTMQHLTDAFGTHRVLRAIQRIGINTSTKLDYGLLLTKGELRDLYHELTCVTKQDFEELIFEIKNAPTPTRGINQATWNELKTSFAEISHIQDCEACELKKLHNLLLPFPSNKEHFFSDDPFFEIHNCTPRIFSDFTMRLTVSQTLECVRTKILSLPEWEFFFTKKLAQPDFAEGLVVAHPDGYLYFEDHIDIAGTHKRIFAPLGKSKIPTHVLYRGTRGSMPMDSLLDIRTTIMEDMSNEIGTYGAIQSYEKTKALFEKKNDLVLLGYSLGGAYAQRDAIAFYEKAQKVVTVCAPGIDSKTTELFAKIVSKHPKPFSIVHASDEDDIVDAAGEAHIGAGCTQLCSVRILSYAPQNKGLCVKMSIPSENIISLVLRLYQVTIAHSRPTSISEHTCLELSTDDPSQVELIDKVLSHDETVYDPYIELLRKKMSYIVVPSFTDFLKEKIPSLTSLNHV